MTSGFSSIISVRLPSGMLGVREHPVGIGELLKWYVNLEVVLNHTVVGAVVRPSPNDGVTFITKVSCEHGEVGGVDPHLLFELALLISL